VNKSNSSGANVRKSGFISLDQRALSLVTIRMIGIAALTSENLAGKAIPPVQQREFGLK
jgi:hypothetical protein